MNWTKTTYGYVSGLYTIARTPGRRWVVMWYSEAVADGKQFARLADARAAAEDHAAAETPAVGPDERLIDGVVVPVDEAVLARRYYDAEAAPADPPEPPPSDPDGDTVPEPTPLADPEPVPAGPVTPVPDFRTPDDRDAVGPLMERLALYRDIAPRAVRRSVLWACVPRRRTAAA